MLLQFKFSNFRSFKEETILDFLASGSNELEYHVRKVGNSKVLPVAAIYGPNASGKSNVFAAYDCMREYVRQSFFFGEDEWDVDTTRLRYDPFKLGDSSGKPSEFEVYYIQDDGRKEMYYSYGFSVDSQGVYEEWLRSNFKTRVLKNLPFKNIFYRKRGEKTEYAKSLNDYINNIEISLDEKTLIVSLGAKLKVPICRNVFAKFLVSETYDSCDIKNELNRYLPERITEDDAVKARVLDYMQAFDDSIIDLKFEKSNEVSGRELYDVFSVHKNEQGEPVRFRFAEESAGTLKMFSLYQYIQDTLDYGAVMFVDELDTRLHPLLVRIIVQAFTDPKKNPNNAQLIFTTHNPTYLNMGLLRRDEIWFTEKENGVTSLFSLDDFYDQKGNKVRKDSDYAKNYLLGVYGAIPDLSSLVEEKRYEKTV